MNIFELEKLLKQDDTLELIFEEIKEIFDKIDYYSRQAFDHQLDNPSVIDKALDVMQGCYGILEPLLAVAETEKFNREERTYCGIKMDKENAGEKFVDASAKKEASNAVAEHRRVRNIIESYVKVCEKAISVLQSRLKKSEESRMSKGEGNE
jgi:hypothetical protein